MIQIIITFCKYFPPLRTIHTESRMSKPQLLLLFLSLLSFGELFDPSSADVGTASQYSPPYTPTACYGNDSSQFPSSNLFGAAGEGVWDNGAACGRQYLVRCISAAVPRSCVQGRIIQIRIVDRAKTSASRPSKEDTTIVLSTTAYAVIANPAVPSINIDFQQV